LAIALVTTAMNPDVLLQIFSGTTSGSGDIALGPFVNALHLAFWAGVGASALGAVVSFMRGAHEPAEARRPAG
jgi:hypothetical protein